MSRSDEKNKGTKMLNFVNKIVNFTLLKVVLRTSEMRLMLCQEVMRKKSNKTTKYC